MKQSTALFKQLNFSYSNLSKLRKSLRHSLQLIDAIHFNPELVERSWLYSNEDKNHLLSMSVEDREALVEEIVEQLKQEWQEQKQATGPTVDEQERQIITKTISKRRTDLAKEVAKDKYTDEERKLANGLLSRIKKPKKGEPENHFTKPIPDQFKDLVEEKTTGKVKSLMKKIIELHEARLEKPVYQQASYGRTTVMQESFFKLPVHNKVELQDDDYKEILESFFSKYFPDYPLKMAVFHGNEKAAKDKDFNSHAHTFLSGRNSKTGNYDLLDRTREVANIYAQQNDLEPVGKGLAEAKRMGEYRQRLFYEHAQEYLNKHKRGVKLYVLEDTEQRRQQREEIRQDANRPKAERKFNQFNYQQERARLNRLELNDIYAKANALSDEVVERVKRLSEQEKQARIELQEIQTKNEEVKKGLELLSDKESALSAFFKKITGITQKIFKWGMLHNNKDTLQASIERREITENLDEVDQQSEQSDFDQSSADLLNPILNSAAQFCEDIEKKHALTDKHKLSGRVKKSGFR